MTLALDRALSQISELGRWRPLKRGAYWYLVKGYGILPEKFSSLERANTRAEEANRCLA